MELPFPSADADKPLSSHSPPEVGPPQALKDDQAQSLSNPNWADVGGSYARYHDVNAPSHAFGASPPHLPHPPPAHTASPLIPHDVENDPLAINQYITSDPRFRDSTLVFPRIHQHSNSSSPLWNRHRITVFTLLATLVALAFLLAAIIGSIKIKD